MLAAVKGEAERRDDNSEGYLSFKDRETEIKWPSLTRGKGRKDISYSLLKRKIMKSNQACVDNRARSLFFTKMELILISAKKGCCRTFKKLMHISRTE